MNQIDSGSDLRDTACFQTRALGLICMTAVCFRVSGLTFFSRKLSELGSRLDFGVQGLGGVIGAAAGQKWSFSVRRMSISLVDGFLVPSLRFDFANRRGTWCMSPSPLSCNSSSFVKDIGKTRIKIIMFRSRSHLLFIWASMFFMRRRGTWCTSPSPLLYNS